MLSISEGIELQTSDVLPQNIYPAEKLSGGGASNAPKPPPQ